MNIKNNNVKKISADLIYSIGALVILNAVIQLFIYPQFENRFGSATYGNILTLLSVVSVIASSFGSAANYSRMLASATRKTENGIYTRFLTVVCIIAIPVGIMSPKIVDLLNSLKDDSDVVPAEQFSIIAAILFSLLIILSVFRYYADVGFRMTLNYKNYFVFYALIAVGYVVGLLLLKFTGSWALALVVGEALALVFAAWKSDIFKGPYFKKDGYEKTAVANLMALSFSNLLSSIVLNADRFLIFAILNSEAVSVFYIASLLGKVISMLSSPLNGVLIGYLSKYKVKFSKKLIGWIVLACAAITVIGSFACYLASVLLIPFLYSAESFAQAKPLFFWANAGQILYFLSNSIMVVIMRMKGEKSSLFVSIAHIVLFIAIVIPATVYGGLIGTTVGIFVTNLIKFILIAAIGLRAAD